MTNHYLTVYGDDLTPDYLQILKDAGEDVPTGARVENKPGELRVWWVDEYPLEENWESVVGEVLEEAELDDLTTLLYQGEQYETVGSDEQPNYREQQLVIPDDDVEEKRLYVSHFGNVEGENIRLLRSVPGWGDFYALTKNSESPTQDSFITSEQYQSWIHLLP